MKKILFILLGFISILTASEILSIKSKDGFILKAWLDFPEQGKPPYPLALMVHEYGSDHSMWRDISKDLHIRGYATLAIDLRGHGASNIRNRKHLNIKKGNFLADAKRIVFKNIPDDLHRWMELMESRKDINIEKPILFGSSLGGGAVIALMLDYEPRAVVTLSPASSRVFHKNEIMESVEDSNTPWLIVSSQKDFAKKSAELYASKAQLPTLLIVPGSGHGSYNLPIASSYIDTFLNRYLKYKH